MRRFFATAFTLTVLTACHSSTTTLDVSNRPSEGAAVDAEPAARSVRNAQWDGRSLAGLDEIALGLGGRRPSFRATLSRLGITILPERGGPPYIHCQDLSSDATGSTLTVWVDSSEHGTSNSRIWERSMEVGTGGRPFGGRETSDVLDDIMRVFLNDYREQNRGRDLTTVAPKAYSRAG